MNNLDKSVGSKSACYGCGLCATICPADVLEISRNHNGFYVPNVINPDACTGCSLCSKVCNYGKAETSAYHSPSDSFSGWSNDAEIRKVCSSGGVAFEIARYYLDIGYKICCVRYNPDTQQAEHYIASSKYELLQSAGSKYLQSSTVKAFSDINLNENHVIIGTPCQIDMWRRYLRLRKKEDNFVLVDFFCHGVPSHLVWDKYLKENSSQIKGTPMVTWRDKKSGWHSSWNICAYDSNNFWESLPYYRSSSKNGDGFYFMFLANGALNPACYSDCKYKKYNSSADIRVGDLWGNKYESDEKGVSGILTFTDKGANVMEQIKITKKKLKPEIVSEGQISEPISRPWYYALTQFALHSDILSINTVKRIVVLAEIAQYQVQKIERIFL